MSQALAYELLADALGVSVSEIDADTAINATPQWDSIAHMRLILALEGKLDRQLDAEEIFAVASVQDVMEVLAARP